MFTPGNVHLVLHERVALGRALRPEAERAAAAFRPAHRTNTTLLDLAVARRLRLVS
jgi:hypothetical protein